MARIKKAQWGERVGRSGGRSCGLERQARKEERQAEKENRRVDRQADREIKREEKQVKREERRAPKLRSGGKTPTRKIKRAQTGIKAAVDNTRVQKPIVKPSVERTSAQEKLKIAKKLYRDNPSKVFKDAVDSAQARLSRAPKQRSGGTTKKKK